MLKRQLAASISSAVIFSSVLFPCLNAHGLEGSPEVVGSTDHVDQGPPMIVLNKADHERNSEKVKLKDSDSAEEKKAKIELYNITEALRTADPTNDALKRASVKTGHRQVTDLFSHPDYSHAYYLIFGNQVFYFAKTRNTMQDIVQLTEAEFRSLSKVLYRNAQEELVKNK